MFKVYRLRLANKENQLKNNLTLTITSLLSILLLTFHLTDDIVHGWEPGTLSNLYNDSHEIRVKFYQDAKSIAPGQSAVFYEGDDVIGGGIIHL